MKKRYIFGMVVCVAFFAFYIFVAKEYASCTPYMLCIFSIPFISTDLASIVMGGSMVFTSFLMLYFLLKGEDLDNIKEVENK